MTTITPDLLVDDVMRRWPATIRVFLDFGFLCVGCPIGCFHSVEDACREHHAELPVFLAALRAAAVQGLPAEVEPA
jgi:hybrid cluster-associated redox disulfide protein